ncbi:MAG: L-rhamnose mutarotase [Dysgonamonadaceae bacterium]|jgi:L-rhamnose mutarotase|nr:L-rhamnose mutarotase [Dysgonamonadaceae bacterium]
MKKIIWSLFTILLLAYSCYNKPKENSPVVFEIITNSLNLSQLNERNQSNNTKVSAYQWKNRLVLFGTFNDLEKTQKELAQLYPESSIRLYDKPFYEFNRKQCDNQNIAPEWEHVVMTADLVADTTLQKEYMDYHARQRELFPEVAQGFCNADFQRLLIFRNGRQLMLIISIPKGKTLDELNPKTVENNPRVDEWNAIMSKYQMGIEGTAPGETWVTFK